MYLFDLNMSKIKSEAPAQECSKRKVFLKILQNSLENTVCASRFYDEDEGCMDKVKHLRSYFTRRRCLPVQFVKFLRTPLRAPTIQ